jgi:hypothetical protein
MRYSLQLNQSAQTLLHPATACRNERYDRHAELACLVDGLLDAPSGVLTDRAAEETELERYEYRLDVADLADTTYHRLTLAGAPLGLSVGVVITRPSDGTVYTAIVRVRWLQFVECRRYAPDDGPRRLTHGVPAS